MKRWQLLLWVLVLGLLLGPIGVGCSSQEDKEKEEASPSPVTVGKAKGIVADLAKRLPDNTLGFMVTSGGGVLAETFKQSYLGQIWNDPGVKTFRQSIETELLKLLEQEEGEEGKIWFNLVKNNVLLALHQPVLIGVAEKPAGEPAVGPPVYGFAILEGGSHKAKIDEALKNLESMIGTDNLAEVKVGSYTFHGLKETEKVPGYWGWVDDYLVFALNDGEGLAIRNLTTGAGANEAALKALKKVHCGDDILAMHVNIEKILKLVQTLIQMDGGIKQGMVETILADLGLKEVKSITGRWGFSGPDMVMEGWVAVPQPFTGLIKSLKPIDMSLFDLVDSRAFSTSAIHVSLVEIYDTVMQMIQKIAPRPEDYQEIQQGIASFEQQMSFQLREELLGSLAGPIVVYSLPAGAMMEAPSGAFAIMMQLKDESKMHKAMSALERFAVAMAAEEAEGILQINTQQQGDATLHLWTIAPLAMLQITPTWMISNNQLMIASSPALARDALKQWSGGGRASIRHQAGFRQVAQNLPETLLGFGYTDSKIQMKQIMMMAGRFWPMVTMFAQQAKLTLPALLPDLTAIADRMGPSCDLLWSQADGLYMRSQGPIPTGGMALVAVGAGMGALVPAVGTARSQAQGTVSSVNVRNICTGCNMYAQDNQGKMPATLQDIQSYIGNERALESPRKPPNFPGPSYIYVEALGGKNRNQLQFPEEIVIVYENPDYCHDKIAVGFLDGHSVLTSLPAFRRMLEDTYKQLGQPMPEI